MVNIENAYKDPEFTINNMSFEMTTLINSQIQTNSKIQELTDKINDLSNTKSVNNITGASSNSNTHQNFQDPTQSESIHTC